MKNTYAESHNNSLFVQGVVQYTSVGSGFLNVKDLNPGALLVRALGAVRYNARRRSIEAQLNSMADYTLSDIGIFRGDIPAFAREWAKSEIPAGTNNGTTISLATRLGNIARRISHWMHRRAIEAQLHGMSDRMLDDIGVERADISMIAREWTGIEAAPTAAKIIGPKSDIDAIVSSNDVTVKAAANDTSDMRAAG